MSLLRLPFLFSSMLFMGISLASLAGAEAQGQGSAPHIVCMDSDFDFGRIVDTNRIGHTFHIRNEGEAPLVITKVRTGCGCVEATMRTEPILPHGMAVLDVVFVTTGRVGPQRKSIYIHSNDPETPIQSLVMHGEVVARRTTDDKSVAVSYPDSGSNIAKRGDYFATPAEITYVLSPGRTNPVTRYIAVRSLAGKPFRVKGVDLPFPGLVENMDHSDPTRVLIGIKDIIPTIPMNGKLVTIKLEDGDVVLVPVVVKGSIP